MSVSQAISFGSYPVAGGRGSDAAASSAGSRHPMIPIRGAASLLSCDAGKVMQMVESGQLLYAWDLSLDPARAKSKEIRVLFDCVSDVKMGVGREFTWQDVKNRLLPEDKEHLAASEIIWILNVSHPHVYNLIKRGELQATRKWKRGRDNGARIRTDSFNRFLMRRCWPVPMEET